MPDFLPQYGNTEGPFGFPLPDKTARALDQVLKALPRSDEFAYRKAVVEKGPSEILPGERSDVSWISVETPDRQKEVVIAKGMNDSQFQGNPLVTLQHNYQLPPVGRSLWRKVARDGDLRGVKAKTLYPQRPESWPKEDTWPPDKAFALPTFPSPLPRGRGQGERAMLGLLQGKSIGFVPIRVDISCDRWKMAV